MADASWYRLDNVGKYYSSQAGRAGQTVFRFAATFVDSISPEALQRALDRSIALFPGFNVKLRSGLFWHYLEPADEVPQVEPERLPICAGLHADLNSVLMRVTYFRHRINLEVSHMISDGRGTLEFFKTLLNAYVEERYHATPALPSQHPRLNDATKTATRPTTSARKQVRPNRRRSTTCSVGRTPLNPRSWNTIFQRARFTALRRIWA